MHSFVGVEITGDSDGQRLAYMKEADLMWKCSLIC